MSQRKILTPDEVGSKLADTTVHFAVYYRVSTEGKVRLETVSLDDAQRYARDIYRAEGVIAAIDEIDRI